MKIIGIYKIINPKPPAFRQAPNVYNGIAKSVAIDAFEEHLWPKVISITIMQIKNIVHIFLFAAIMSVTNSMRLALSEISRVATRPARHAPGPQKPPFLACQKVAPPPCKKPPFLHFPRRKACNFDQFVHENAHF
jgi:hypothetical protein